MQIFARLPALSVRAAAFALLVALSACDDRQMTVDTTALDSLAPTTEAEGSATSEVKNIAPTISGTPATTAMIGAVYSFTPSATDVNQNKLTFSIQNKPAWATFNSATGQLVGTPNAPGVTANVLIAVSDGKATTSLAAFTLSVSAQGAAQNSVLVSWSTPTVNTDGTALTDLAGYHLYYGTDPAQLTRVDIQGASTLTYSAGNLSPGTYYFTVASYNSSGVESAQPAVLSTVIA